MPEAETEVVHLRMPKDLLDAAREKARREDRTVGSVLVRAIRSGLRKILVDKAPQ